MSSTTGFDSVPVTNGHSTWVPTPHCEIWRPTGGSNSTTGQPSGWERVYPLPETQPDNEATK